MDLHQEVVIMLNFGLKRLIIIVIQQAVKLLIIPTIVILLLKTAKVVIYHLIVHKNRFTTKEECERLLNLYRIPSQTLINCGTCTI